MSVDIKALSQNFQFVKHNPALLTKLALDLVQEQSDGKVTITDPTNPVVLLLEWQNFLAANCVNEVQSGLRKQYAKLASKPTDLYNHMSDIDYLGRFSTPSLLNFVFYISKRELMEHAVSTGVSGGKKLVIPKHTLVDIDGYRFCFLYAVELQIAPHGAIQVLFNGKEKNPLSSLETNIVDWTYFDFRFGDEDDNSLTECLRLNIPLLQLDVQMIDNGVLYNSTGFHKTFDYTDNFVYARCYLDDSNGRREEIKTTHSDLVYDLLEITAYLQVDDTNKQLKVSIPSIYFQNRINNRSLVIEIFTSKGPLNIDFSEYANTQQQTLLYPAYQDVDETQYTAPLKHLERFGFWATGYTTGGSNPLSFEALRDRVINGGVYADEPITPNELENNARLKGYKLTKSIDLLTNRIYYATKALPVGQNNKFSRGAAASIETVLGTLKAMAKIDTINDNGLRITITPDTIFRTSDGITTVVSTDDIPTISQLGQDSFIQKINSLEYAYTPFHYCLDATEDVFSIRPYYMDNPKILGKRFIVSNDSSLLSVAVFDTFITREEYGYKLRIHTRADDTYRKLDVDKKFCQIAFGVANNGEIAYVNAEAVYFEEEDVVWEARIDTRFDFTQDNHLIVNNFKMYTQDQRNVEIKLSPSFSVIFGLYDYEPANFERNAVDDLLGVHLLDQTRFPIGAAIDEVEVELGRSLDNFWVSSRTSVSDNDYLRWDQDVNMTYHEDVFEIDPETGIPKYTEVGGVLQYKIKHRKGSNVVDENGQVVLKHRIGDIRHGADGLPLIKHPREVIRIIDIFLVDGIYRFANVEADIRYKESIPQSVLSYLDGDVKQFAKRLLENTRLYYSPKKTMGNIEVVVEGGVTRSIPARMPFTVRYFMSEIGYNNTDLKNAIVKMTHLVINEMLELQTVSVDLIAARLREGAGSEVMAVDLKNMGINQDIVAYTVKEPSASASVKRIVKQLSNGTLEVQEDITVDFVRHQTIV